ncbi:TusE/DsrC/DsvC family sulfur relay protein [Thiococcus pfennigii]|jgi:tRNA 2-thiouridine synthesizing protein E|uniref:TusE/DsrC/DsvC family sulfur relay protein n=1 Tax=Thiococcus pfennigii TaxID=1057 RepID=UPI0019030276|nr:TusE/DsrC/DsvC family sulfur relay protein [Thiococcus pfennigii]MBK1702431.1 TusE/DsrC/DsvC family sulfurtransferase [Thiococcus pfennigii]MBK1733627.1 TusE/DsrC/DsvC family sulfurtransferase [Thiococcus pfennigii]
MPAIQLVDPDLSLNKRGFLADFDAWNRDVARTLAAAEGLTLGEDHWIVLDFLRDYFRTHAIPATPRVVLCAIGDRLTPPGVPAKRRHLEALFPNGGCKQACRLAGLPDYFCYSC